MIERPNAFMIPDDCAAGGVAAGKYLQSIGVFDMAALKPDQWRTFCIILVSEANRSAGQRFVDAWTVPFE